MCERLPAFLDHRAPRRCVNHTYLAVQTRQVRRFVCLCAWLQVPADHIVCFALCFLPSSASGSGLPRVLQKFKQSCFVVIGAGVAIRGMSAHDNDHGHGAVTTAMKKY